MAKSVAKFLCQGYTLIFRALAMLLSDWGATFESNIMQAHGHSEGKSLAMPPPD